MLFQGIKRGVNNHEMSLYITDARGPATNDPEGAISSQAPLNQAAALPLTVCEQAQAVVDRQL